MTWYMYEGTSYRISGGNTWVGMGGVDMYHHNRQVWVGFSYCDTYQFDCVQMTNSQSILVMTNCDAHSYVLS
jgi:hypothetical protein